MAGLEHEEDPFERERRALKARHEARMEDLRVRMDVARRLLQERICAHHERMAAAGRAKFPPMHDRTGRIGGEEGRRRPRRDRGDDGEPIPAVPKPRPNPLSGAAAAPIE